ncbi:MAG: hypothetical protein PHP61_06640 [Candidatus Izemoplasmatales bacterium]|nr:hypothetical protein [Candidatus Izemoplasmatales bacterium]MDD4988132.1 hypothetical protein [Candidatus Izemoplasmatales bacterium]MDD5602177.1 hypothetical protein [Candidatus Izemoplasmatales bacterium]MDY0373548.1 hypothetical protein [Candidatus Izemoplasmatales bacterium]NLF48793.1 hypothetical protein [Acholeplasmataceae bacterium]
MTIRKLRTIDLIIFTVVGSILDIVIGLKGFFGIVAFVSIGIPLVVLSYIRWGKYALLANLVLAIVHLFLFEAPFLSRLAHSLALMLLSCSLFIQRWSFYRVTRLNFGLVVGLYIALYLIMFFGEWCMLLIFQMEIPLENLALNHSINILVGSFLLGLMAIQKELLVHMDPYLREKSEENKQHE